jgi:hypothetical protein
MAICRQESHAVVESKQSIELNGAEKQEKTWN